MTNFKTLFSKTDSRDKDPFFGFGTSAQADWKIIFFSTVLIIIVVSILNVVMFIKIDKGEIFVVKENNPMSKNALNLEKLKETNLYYKNKALEFESLKKGTSSPVVDPSL